MEVHFHDNPAFTVGLALACGMAAQALAKHLRVPGLVLLFVAGVALGPDGANLVQPASLGRGLSTLVGFAVAVILFEGGMTLDLVRLRRNGRAINQLISLGALASVFAGAVVASVFAGFDWRLSFLFGTLVIVTGPTVVTPLLKQLRVKKSVATVLEAEGVLIDAVGAITAAVAIEVVLSPSGESWALALPSIGLRLGFGTVVGLLGGFLLAGLLRFRRVIPEGLKNTFTLGWAVLVFEAANAVFHESGIAAVTVAGLVVGNTHTADYRSLHKFKEELTIMLIALLFVLLVADVRVADVQALGFRGALVAAATIFIVRPLSVAVGTWGSSLSAKERLFVGWIGPRGIVAAAVASLFAIELDNAGVSGGTELRALVFLVIAVTVFWSALTGPLAAQVLGLRRPADDGWVIVGASPLGRLMARLLEEAGSEVVVVDEHADRVKAATDEGYRALHRDPLDPGTLNMTKLESRVGAIAVLDTEEENYLFGEKSRLAVPTVRFPLALTSEDRGVTPDMVRDFGGELLFAQAVDLNRWNRRVDRGEADVVWYQRQQRGANSRALDAESTDYLPLIHWRGSRVEPYTSRSRIHRHSTICVLRTEATAAAIDRLFEEDGWARVESPNPEADRDVLTKDPTEVGA